MAYPFPPGHLRFLRRLFCSLLQTVFTLNLSGSHCVPHHPFSCVCKCCGTDRYASRYEQERKKNLHGVAARGYAILLCSGSSLALSLSFTSFQLLIADDQHNTPECHCAECRRKRKHELSVWAHETEPERGRPTQKLLFSCGCSSKGQDRVFVSFSCHQAGAVTGFWSISRHLFSSVSL